MTCSDTGLYASLPDDGHLSGFNVWFIIRALHTVWVRADETEKADLVLSGNKKYGT